MLNLIEKLVFFTCILQQSYFSRVKKSVKILISCLALSLMGLSGPVQAENLLDVFTQAARNDPTFLQAQADWLSAQEQLPLAISALYPTASGQIQYDRDYNNITTDASFAVNGSFNTRSIGLNLSQPIFDWSLWTKVKSANASVKGATATFAAANQDLIVRTVKAYLSVLQANDKLHFTQASTRAVKQELDTAREKYEVGLAAKTDVDNAQAKYDQSVAQGIADLNSLNSRIEDLHAITGGYYTELNGLCSEGVPLVSPEPNNINAWAETAEKQNYQLLSQNYNMIVAREKISTIEAGHLPTLYLQASYTDSTQYQRTLVFNGKTEDLNARIGVVSAVVNVPIFAGGSVLIQSRQARYDYASASAKLEYVHRQVVGQTREAFLGINSNINQIKADLQSIKSSKYSLASTKESYHAGTRTFVDVLNDTSNIYQTQDQYANDQYAYINNFVALKNSAGTLSPVDLQVINEWLCQKIKLAADNDDNS